MQMLGSRQGAGEARGDDGYGAPPPAAPRAPAPVSRPAAAAKPAPQPDAGGDGFGDLDDDIPF
jgi:single-strand DNA-binding protein